MLPPVMDASRGGGGGGGGGMAGGAEPRRAELELRCGWHLSCDAPSLSYVASRTDHKAQRRKKARTGERYQGQRNKIAIKARGQKVREQDGDGEH